MQEAVSKMVKTLIPVFVMKLMYLNGKASYLLTYKVCVEILVMLMFSSIFSKSWD